MARRLSKNDNDRARLSKARWHVARRLRSGRARLARGAREARELDPVGGQHAIESGGFFILFSHWDAWTAIGTMLMAVATFVVVLQGRRHREDDDRQYRDGYRPLCALTPYDGVDPRHRRDTLLTISDQQDPNQGFGIIEIRCALRNIGLGPALNVRIMFRFLDMEGYLTSPWELSPLRPEEHRGSESEAIRIPVQFGKHFNQTDFSQVVGKQWEIILTYEDIFGGQFYSVHRKRPLQLEKLYRAAVGSEFVAPSEPWVTFGKGRFSP